MLAVELAVVALGAATIVVSGASLSGNVVWSSSDHPPAIEPASPAWKSPTQSFHVPVGFVPVNVLLSVAEPPAAGPGWL